MKLRARFLLQPALLGAVALIAIFSVVAGAAHVVRRDLAAAGGGGGSNRLINVSCRGPARNGADAMVVGFVVEGGPQNVVIRGLGPSLARAGVAGALMKPRLRVVRHADGVDVGRNESWRVAGNERLWGDLAHFAPAEREDAACVLTLLPGGYSALVEPQSGTGGVAGIEIFVVRD